MFASGAKDGSDVTDATTDGEAPPLNLETFLPYRLAVLSSVVSQALSQVYANHGLTMSEWFVLMTLGERSPATGKAVSATLRMHKTKVSRIVSSLLERKLISRRFNQADLRQAFLELTPLGAELYRKCVPAASEFVKLLSEEMPEAERAALERGLARLTTHSEQWIARRPVRREPT
jgi:DNA-binding MarR family transcriptional regulator